MLKRILAGIAIATMLLASAAVTSPFDDGQAADRRGDYAEALKLYRLAADQGDAKAQVNIGEIYNLGLGVPKDAAEAVKWFRLAGEQGNARAQNYLGIMYRDGEGVAQDYTEAAKWYRLQAEQGKAHAQFQIGTMFGNGQGVPQDYVLAHMWFNLSAGQGTAGAAEYRDTAASRMTPDQIAEAQRLARDWKPATPAQPRRRRP